MLCLFHILPAGTSQQLEQSCPCNSNLCAGSQCLLRTIEDARIRNIKKKTENRKQFRNERSSQQTQRQARRCHCVMSFTDDDNSWSQVRVALVRFRSVRFVRFVRFPRSFRSVHSTSLHQLVAFSFEVKTCRTFESVFADLLCHLHSIPLGSLKIQQNNNNINLIMQQN